MTPRNGRWLWSAALVMAAIIVLIGACLVSLGGCGAEMRIASAEDVQQGFLNAKASVAANLDAEVNALSAKLETKIKQEVSAARDAINKTTTNNGISGRELTLAFIAYMVVSKGFNWLATRKRSK